MEVGPGSLNWAFRRRLRQVLVGRLRDGHEPEVLLAQLQARLTATDADTILAEAEAELRRSSRRSPPGVRPLSAVAYTWTVMLILQNVGILSAVAEAGNPGSLTPVSAPARLKIVALGLAAVGWWRWRRSFTTAVYVGAVLYGFPFGLLVDHWMAPIARPSPAPATWLSVPAFASYVATVAILAAWWVDRQSRNGTPDPSAFD